jgi:hypothetical protein
MEADMGGVFSIHEYDLRAGVTPQDFERALRAGERRGLLALPGLGGHRFLRGLRGERQGRHAALWWYDRREDWETLWGPIDRPHPPSEHPPSWRIWEDNILAPFLDRLPDQVRFTAYEVID